ncbi:hypothetical protein J416_12929 [Gracilibacillus halophilus YIM-C55.5]|uniref:General stress protein n=1 Tax=Gracilibacillus halophilus YIM-C55.5 TaxID=1308866 RepID=N4WS90_9BACI|nr:YtxH domain-containing protein [Gracilibacillus halophilus]ENH96031.1 hypothetical protein J416_12929 [Gracilibacillus halophilus YIM-C55.5]
MINAKSLFIGVVTGSVIGAATTLLTTPKSGKELRTDVKHRSNEVVQSINHLREEGFDLKDQIAKTSKEGAALIRDLSADVKQSVESWKKTVEPHQKNIQKYLTQIEESLKELEDKTQQNDQSTS